MATSGIDVLDGLWDESAWWSTSNMGEAVPGVLTPLNWTFWGVASEHAVRRAFVSFGTLEKSREPVPEDPTERIMGVFHGRLAAKVSFLGDMGDRLPGTSGASVAEQILGALPEGFVSRPIRRRLPLVAVRLPVTATRAPKQVRRLRTNTDKWWQDQVASAPTLDLDQARALFAEAVQRFDDAMTTHIRCVFAVVQPLYDIVRRLAALAGQPALADRVLTGQGMHAELDMVQDLWDLSHEMLTMQTFIRRHGYHGPNEGEISSHVWREDPEPISRMAISYADHPDSDAPTAVAARRAAERLTVERELCAALPPSRRVAARAVLRLAARYMPLRGMGKVAYLQVLDVARASSRRIAAALAASGVIEHPDDVAMLTVTELLTASPGMSLHDVVSARRERHREHTTVVVPAAWRGRPDIERASTADESRDGLVLHGIGACLGIVEGTARVVLDPTFAEVEPGEILIAPFTDPSWASIMFTADALVVDIGGVLSHAAVVARELGIPCVMGTGDGTRRIATGDICRVDGSAGTVEILRITPAPTAMTTGKETVHD
jgi:phosphohistidine swiveling domain-containing protein